MESLGAVSTSIEALPVGDPYPSRIGGEGRILPRRDPVVHPSPAKAEPGPLSAAQLEEFDRDGFIILPHLLDDAVPGLRRRLDELLQERRDDASPEVVREPDGDGVRSIFRVHDTDAVFADLVRNPRLSGIAEQILGSAVYVHQSRVNLKPGFEGKKFYWHSDFETWHVEDGMPRMRALSCAVNLDDNFVFNGPLMLVPASHRHYVACAGRTPEQHYLHSLRKQEYGVPDHRALEWLCREGGIVTATGPAGSATFFECNLMHGSTGNMTPFPRSNVFFVYNSVENALVQPFSSQAPRPEHIASRRFTPLSNSQPIRPI